jgi:hypothetical protein
VVVGAGGAAIALVSRVIWGCEAVVVDASVATALELEATVVSEDEVDDALDVLSVAVAELELVMLVVCSSVVVCSVDASVGYAACVELLPIVVTTTPGHTAGTPAPSMKTPIMDVSGTSTFAHCLETRAAIWTRPWTHCALQRTLGAKSLA